LAEPQLKKQESTVAENDIHKAETREI